MQFQTPDTVFDAMSSSSNFRGNLTITHVGTATALIEVSGVTFITDPYLSPAETSWHPRPGVTLTSHYTPSHTLETLPPIDTVLLSHEDHPDNLDELGRRLLDGRRVLTTMDGAQKLGPRPGIRGITPWETVSLDIGGKHFDVMGTPCQHLPGGECTGFVITSPEFGTADNGKPNGIYFSGDTVYLEELARIRDDFHVSVALFNIGAAMVVSPDMPEPMLITMDGKQAARLIREICADVMIPLHFESWDHFTEDKEKLAKVLKSEGVDDKVCWLELGIAQKIF